MAKNYLADKFEMQLESLSLADFKNLRELRPDCARFADFILVQTYEEFVNILYQNIDECIRLMEGGRNLRKNDGEDRLTEDFRMFLRAKGYQARHDENINGHSDLVVSQKDKPYLWLGEAKIHDGGYTYLRQGFDQLTTRYSLGTEDAFHGGLLIYIRQPKAAKIIATWKKRLAAFKLDDYSESECAMKPNLAFFSTHCHESSGLPFTVRHMAIVLHHNPQDK
jgi:hypothetical protein